MDVNIHVHKDEEFTVKVNDGTYDAWLDFVVVSEGRANFFIPHDRTVEVAEKLLRAGMDLLEQTRARREAEECPDPPTTPDS